MDIIEAVSTRRSIRAFKPDPVPLSMLKEIMSLAVRAPSWANTQPWEFAIVTGDRLEQIRAGFVEKAEQEPGADIPRPEEFPEPYDSRRRQVGASMLKLKGIKREDREGRGWWRLQGFRHFEAPCVIYLLIDRSFYYQPSGHNVWTIFDCGLVAENIMLLAAGYGLGTITQAQAVVYPDVLRKVLRTPESKLFVLGIAIGYPAPEDPLNRFRSEREPFESVTRWYGFGETPTTPAPPAPTPATQTPPKRHIH